MRRELTDYEASFNAQVRRERREEFDRRIRAISRNPYAGTSPDPGSGPGDWYFGTDDASSSEGD